MAIVKDETKSTILAHDDDNRSDVMQQPESLSSPTTVAITSANAKFSGRFKAKSDHAKYDIPFVFSLPFRFRSLILYFWFSIWLQTLYIQKTLHLDERSS